MTPGIVLSRTRVRRLILAIVAVNALMLAGTWASVYYVRFPPQSNRATVLVTYLLVQLNLATENVVAAWYSSMLLLLVGVGGVLCWFVDRDDCVTWRERYLRHGWLVFALIFTGLSLDEMGSFHERIKALSAQSLFPHATFGALYIQLPAIALVATALIAFSVVHLGRAPWARAFLAAGVLLFLTVPADEQAEMGLVAADPSLTHLWIWHGMEILVEEGTELFGTLCFLIATLIYARAVAARHGTDAGDLQVRIPLPTADPRTSRVVVALISLLAAAMLAIHFIMPYLPDADTGIPANWFPSALGTLAAVLCVAWWDSQVLQRRSGGRALALVAGVSVAVSMYCGANVYAYGTWDPWDFLRLVLLASLMVPAAVAAFLLGARRGTGWRGAAIAWVALLALAFFGPTAWSPVSAFAAFAVLLPGLVSLSLQGAAWPHSPRRRASWPLRIVGVGAGLAACSVPVRAALIGFTLGSFRAPFEEIPKMLIGACYDVAYAAALTSAFLLAALACRRAPRVQRFLFAVFLAVALFSQLASLANIEIVRMLGRPFNYNWLYYSDFLRSTDAQQAIAATFSWPTAALALSNCLALLFGAALAGWCLQAMRSVLSRREFVLLLLPLLVVYLALSHWYLVTAGWSQAKLVNPVASFAASLVESADTPALFTMTTPVGTEDFRGAAAVGPLPPPARAQDASAIRNVVLFVFESTAASYMEPYGGTYAVTPELTKYRSRAALFRNVYAHAPGTNQSLVSILSSTYPLLSYSTLTKEHPQASLQSLSGELKRAGYDTAFFSSADLRFNAADSFLAHRDLDLVQDYRDRTCATQPFQSEWWYDIGSSDECTVATAVDWMANRRERPFFATVWTGQTHKPYFVAGPETDYGVDDPDFNRYLNALRESDQALGQLLRGLDERQMLDSTLVVVLGDHGEAFGQHGQYAHGTALYEENVHVPFMLINPVLFAGEEYAPIGGLVDVAPTIFDLLKRPAPGAWQGHSLFSAQGHERAYFCAPWSDFLFGYRDGTRKLIFNSTQGVFEVYDLADDPHETVNVAAHSRDFVLSAQQHLAAWVQYQARFYDQLFSRDAEAALQASSGTRVAQASERLEQD